MTRSILAAVLMLGTAAQAAPMYTATRVVTVHESGRVTGAARPGHVHVMPVTMHPSQVNNAILRVNRATFSSDEMSVIRNVAAYHYLTANQVRRLIDAMTFESDKVAAVRILAPKVVDPHNAFVIESSLTFSSDRRKVARIFGY